MPEWGSSHSQCVVVLLAHNLDQVPTSQALRSRCRSWICVLSARPSRRALWEMSMSYR